MNVYIYGNGSPLNELIKLGLLKYKINIHFCSEINDSDYIILTSLKLFDDVLGLNKKIIVFTGAEIQKNGCIYLLQESIFNYKNVIFAQKTSSQYVRQIIYALEHFELEDKEYNIMPWYPKRNYENTVTSKKSFGLINKIKELWRQLWKI